LIISLEGVIIAFYQKLLLIRPNLMVTEIFNELRLQLPSPFTAAEDWKCYFNLKLHALQVINTTFIIPFLKFPLFA
jgi:hypothetical protein